MESITTCSTPVKPAVQKPLQQQQQQQQQQPQDVDAFVTTSEEWYSQGERLLYDPTRKVIVEDSADDGVRVFCRTVLPPVDTSSSSTSTSSTSTSSSPRWTTFLPGNPEGSYQFSQVEDALSGRLLLLQEKKTEARGRCDTDRTDTTAMSADSSLVENDDDDSTDDDDDDEDEDCVEVQQGEEEEEDTPSSATATATAELPQARLYLDYLGQGDSDTTTVQWEKQQQQQHGTTATASSLIQERADLVEALWEKHGIQRTVVVSVDESSLVVLELLQRQRHRLALGQPFPKILHVLALNGRYVAKTRHTAHQSPIKQVLRSDRMGLALAQKCQTSDLVLHQVLACNYRGLLSSSSSSSPRKQWVKRELASIVRRHEGAVALRDMALTVDDHLAHKYRWHLPLLIKSFCLNQGITCSLWTTHRAAKGQVSLVQQHLADYYGGDDAALLEDDTVVPVVHRDLTASLGLQASSTAFLLNRYDPTSSSASALQPFLTAVQQLVREEIPLSDNSCHYHHHHSSSTTTATTTDHYHSQHDQVSYSEQHSLVGAATNDDNDDNSNYVYDDQEEFASSRAEEQSSVDSRLDTEIVVDWEDNHLDSPMMGFAIGVL